jgi:hypothetical protein
MKKNLIFLSTALFASLLCFTSCNKVKPGDKTVSIEITLDTPSFTELTYGEPVDIKGQVVSDIAATSLTFTGVKGTEGAYTAVGEVQSLDVAGLTTESFTMSYMPDSKEITAIEVKASVGEFSEVAYVTVGSVTGEAKGSVWFNSNAILRADIMVPNHQNDPDTYPNPNTGAPSDTPSYLSIHGVEINGTKKHILSVDEVRSVEGAGVSYIFGNVLQNTSNKAYIGGQRGYFFMDLSNLSSGTIGRQCDAYEIGGKSIKAVNRDIAVLKVIPGSWHSGYDDAKYKFVDALFMSLSDEPATTVAKLRAYRELCKIQETLDNAKLGVEEDPTSLGGAALVRHLVDAGDNAAALKKDYTENFRAGDYIIIRSEVPIDENTSDFYYGIILVKQMPNWTNALVDMEDPASPGTFRKKLDREKTQELFLQPLVLDIKTQIKL